MTSPNEEDIAPVVEEIEVVEWVEPAPKKKRRRKPIPPIAGPSIASLFDNAIQEGKSYIDAQIELVKVKAKLAMSQAAGALGFAVAAGIFALMMLWWTFHTGEVALALVMAPWAASLTTWGILLLLTLICAGVAAILGLGAKKDAPNPKEMVQDDIETLKADIVQAKEGLKK